jgi:predicted Zn finger-like uncharacterized protein
MDVTCDRCSTEYEFEETLVSPRGTTVKCTQCGHLFKVYRLPTSLRPALGSHWTVRRVDGSSHQLPSLGDLTRLITEGTFARDDEVSRTGKVWRRLGDVEELESFFAEADRRGPSRARRTTQGPVLGLAVQKSPANPAAERSSPRPTELASNAPVRSALASVRAPEVLESRHAVSSRPGATPAAISSGPQDARANDEDEVATEQRPLIARSAPSSDSAPAARVAPGSSNAEHAPAAQAPQLEPVPSQTAPLPATGRPAATRPIEFPDLSDRTELEPPPRSSLWLWLFAVLSTGLAVSTWLLWPMPASQAKRATLEDPSGQFLARADAAFATHRIEHFEQAITDYIKTLAFHESDAHVLSSLSRVYAVWAQEILFSMQADEREPDKSKHAQRSENSAANATHVQKLSEQAKLYAETAARKNPGNAEAEVALSDALRLTGNLVAARSELDRARATDRDPSAETLRVAALLTIDEAGGNARAGVSLASQAVAKEPDVVRTQVLLARCLVGDGDVQGAHYHLQLITTRDRGHPSALAVEKLIDQLAAPAQTPDAAAPETAPDASSAPQFESLSHEGYVSRGQALLEAGQVTTAKRMFEQALFIRPNSSQAHAGLGYVALEKGRPQLAAEHFLAATRVGNDDALIGLGDAYRRMSRPRDALRAYQNYLTRNPNGRHASIAQAQVERLSEETGRPKKAP